MKYFILLCAALAVGAEAIALPEEIIVDNVGPHNMSTAFKYTIKSGTSGNPIIMKLNDAGSTYLSDSYVIRLQKQDNGEPTYVRLEISGSSTLTGNDGPSSDGRHATLEVLEGTTLTIAGSGTLKVGNRQPEKGAAYIGGYSGGDTTDRGTHDYDWSDGNCGYQGKAGASMGTLIIESGTISTSGHIGGGEGGKGGKGETGRNGASGHGHGRNGGCGGQGGQGGDGGTLKVYGGKLTAADIRGGSGGTAGNGGNGGKAQNCCGFDGGNGGSGGHGGLGGTPTQIEIYGGNVNITNTKSYGGSAGSGGTGGGGCTLAGSRGSNGSNGSSGTDNSNTMGSVPSTKNIIIRGGNVNLTEANAYKQPVNPTTGATNEACYLNIIPLGSSYANKPLKEGTVIDNVRCVLTKGTVTEYGIKDVQTDAQGKLYFWFPNRWGK